MLSVEPRQDEESRAVGLKLREGPERLVTCLAVRRLPTLCGSRYSEHT